MKKLFALFLALCMIFAFAACGDNTEDKSKDEPANAEAVENTDTKVEAKYLTQVVNMDMFGNSVEVTFTQDAAGTQYMFAYEFAGNNIEASGEIVDGVYTLTDDPSGFAVDAELGIYALLTSSWEGDNGETITLDPAAAPEKGENEGSFKHQIVTVDMMGDMVDVAMTVDGGETAFTMEYLVMGDLITAYGSIADGKYTVTDDPSSFGAMMIEKVAPLLTANWVDGKAETPSTESGEDAPAGGEITLEGYDKYQIVTVDLFGDKIDVTVGADEAETVFGIQYTAMGNLITASGTIADGVYTITDDPSGYAGMMMQNLAPLITDQWS